MFHIVSPDRQADQLSDQLQDNIAQKQAAASFPPSDGLKNEMFSSSFINKEKKKGLKSRRLVLGIFGGMLGLALAYALNIWWQDEGVTTSTKAFTYFEIKIIDPSGHPAQGVEVSRVGAERQLSEALGHSDAFGEWRRFLKLNSGEKVLLRFQKNNSWVAEKEIKIPANLKPHQDYEIKTQIALSKQEPKLSSAKKKIQ